MNSEGRLPPRGYLLARRLDQTLLKPGTTPDEAIRAAAQAAELGFAAFCHPPSLLPQVAPVLEKTATAAQTVIGFPLGFQSVKTKTFETEEAVDLGALEIDLVVNRGFIKAGAFNRLENEIASVVNAAAPVTVKTILETSDLTLDEILAAADVAHTAGAAFVKTSTGFYGPGADLEIVKILTARFAGRLKIKASGGIRDLAAAWAFIQAGADRIGTSSGAAVLAEFNALVAG